MLKILSYIMFAVSLFFGYMIYQTTIYNSKIEREIREVQDKYKTLNLKVVSVYVADSLEYKYDEFSVETKYKAKMVSDFNDTVIIPLNEIDGRYRDITGKVFTYNNPNYIELAELGIIKPIDNKMLDMSFYIIMCVMSLIVGTVLFNNNTRAVISDILAQDD